MEPLYDLAIIGGGVNGCGIARDAAGRGLKVVLCEQNDLASGTSSAATKLIHGGLRYLEYYEFRLVREALAEREVLWGIAPHIIWPLRFVLPYHRGLRPAWLLRLGLFLYDHLGGRKRLPPARTLDLTHDPAGRPLKPGAFKKAFEYSDCWAEDSRLVVLNARDAADRGATILTRCKAVGATRGTTDWTLALEDAESGTRRTVRARVVVNAAGPWIGQVARAALGVTPSTEVRLVQGSHVVVRKLYEHDRCYLFQNADGRVLFTIPYEQDFTLIGTTDRDYAGDPSDVKASAEEIAYICRAASEYLAHEVTEADIVWSYSGVRPLYGAGGGDAKAVTRDYLLALDTDGGAPLLSIFGGKLTTYRRLAEHAMDLLAPLLPQAKTAGWTARAPLPGGDFAIDGFDALVADIKTGWPFLTPAHATRLARLYGTRARTILAAATSMDELGLDFGATLTEAEVSYLIEVEWARTATDIVWRRTKLGLRLSPAQIEILDSFVQARRTEAGRRKIA